MAENSRVANVFRIIIVLSATIGVVLNSLGATIPLKQFIYFTLQSNVLIVIVYFILLLKKEHNRIFNIIKNQATLGIILTGLVFNLILRPVVDSFDYNPNTLSDFLVHSLTPILVLLDFIIFTSHGQVRKFDPIYWLTFPLFYWIFTLAYVALGGNFNGKTYESNYPYFFLNFEKFGVGYFLLVLVLILLIGYLLYFFDSKILKRLFRK